jgi:hypothetical protein
MVAFFMFTIPYVLKYLIFDFFILTLTGCLIQNIYKKIKYILKIHYVINHIIVKIKNISKLF